MGYRSEVIIYIEEQKDKKLNLNKIIKDYKKISQTDDDDEFKIGKNSSGNRVLYFNNPWIKWYSDYETTIFWENLLSELEPEQYLFIREGEEYGDFETEGYYGEAYARTDVEIIVDFKE